MPARLVPPCSGPARTLLHRPGPGCSGPASRGAHAGSCARAAYDVLDRLPLSPAHSPLRKPLLGLALQSGRLAAALTSPPFAAALVSAAAAALAVNGAGSGQALPRATVAANGRTGRGFAGDAARGGGGPAAEPGPGLVAMWPRITREHA